MPYITARNMYGNKVLVEVSEETYHAAELGHKRYVLMKDTEGRNIPVEVPEEVYSLFVGEYRFWERDNNDHRNHLDDRSLDDYAILRQAVSESLEETCLRRELLNLVYEVLQSCTPVQRERFYLKQILGFTYHEIAHIQGCNKYAVQKSVKEVAKKLKNIFK